MTAKPTKPGAPRVAHYVLVTNPALEQPHHVQLRGANGEPVMWSEQYADERDAEHVLDIAAEAAREGERLKRERSKS